ncbi:MAG: helix-hairpin-helix domain-containing protein [SAR86 cluster bacterium]|jgi:competence protein ComEA|uniref:Helix-hairpin-helix domain-containing protein n=1 Tax=SAR86 cluster bacterium TaxID=2030880 RepID=A0A973A782_9GAMM|nr:helix-hairpin-helix domain-containing protein [SAR86 cluster bacterium]|tara:strand:- start:10920 stop:11216 length:297 start_codon:yes stop_codon:yes gene_type:complete
MKKGLIFTFVSVLVLSIAQWSMANDDVSVNINSADAETIASVLVGVGVEKAKAIVAYREQHGRFYVAEELTAVKGIGKSTVLKNEARIRIDDEVTSSR